MRNGDEKLFHGKIGKAKLKIAERFARLLDNYRIVGLIVRNRISDKTRTTPETAVRSYVIIFSVQRRLKMQNVSFRRNSRGFDFFPYVFRNRGYVFHHLDGIFEYVRVNSLQAVILHLAVAVKINFIRTVYMSVLKRFEILEIALQTELPANILYKLVRNLFFYH